MTRLALASVVAVLAHLCSEAPENCVIGRLGLRAGDSSDRERHSSADKKLEGRCIARIVDVPEHGHVLRATHREALASECVPHSNAPVMAGRCGLARESHDKVGDGGRNVDGQCAVVDALHGRTVAEARS